MRLFSIVLLLNSLVAASQPHADSLKAQLIRDWVRAKTYTAEFLEAMPAEKYGWSPVANSRTFAQQFLHTSWLTIGFVSNGTGQERKLFDADLSKSLEETIPPTKEVVKKYVLGSYDFAIEGLRRMPASQLFERGKRNEFKLAWITKAYEHLTHHRGQCVLYLRLAGVEPPEEKLF